MEKSGHAGQTNGKCPTKTRAKSLCSSQFTGRKQGEGFWRCFLATIEAFLGATFPPRSLLSPAQGLASTPNDRRA